MAASLFGRYIWLVNTIYSAGKISKHEIDKQWIASPLNTEHEQGYEARSFHRHKEAIWEELGIAIQCERKNGHHLYYIAQETEAHRAVYQRRLLSMLSQIAVADEDKNVRSRVLFEDVPNGFRWFTPIVDAMRKEVILEVTYRFENEVESSFLLMPYCLKEFQRHWYVVGRSSQLDELVVYDLDRISHLSFSQKRFKFPRSWKAAKHFEGYFATDRSAEPQTITIKVTGNARKHLIDHPLHPSQHTIEQTPDYVVLSYWLAPTKDFVQALRALGAQVEVLAPGSLRQLFINDTQRQAKIYGMNMHYVGEQLSLF